MPPEGLETLIKMMENVVKEATANVVVAKNEEAVGRRSQVILVGSMVSEYLFTVGGPLPYWEFDGSVHAWLPWIWC